MLLNITDLSAEPQHHQISRQLIDKILEGELVGGSHILSPRALACKNRVSLGTVKKAYSDLEREGLISSNEKDDFIVSDLSEKQKRNAGKQLHPNERPIQHFSPNQKDILLKDELNTARMIQFDLLPKILPDDEQLILAASTTPCSTIGGDFYDYVPLDENRFIVVIGDACGKGLPGALLVSQIQAVLKNEFHKGCDLKEIFQNLNDQLVAYTPKDKFVTLFCGIFDRSTGLFEYVNAGHNFPFIVREDSRCEFMRIGGSALGIIPGVLYQTESTFLTQGDTFCLYTDGVTETMNEKSKEYGDDRLLGVIIENRTTDGQEMIKLILEDLNRYRGRKQQQDDQTILLMKIRNQKRNCEQILNSK